MKRISMYEENLIKAFFVSSARLAVHLSEFYGFRPKVQTIMEPDCLVSASRHAMLCIECNRRLNAYNMPMSHVANLMNELTDKSSFLNSMAQEAIDELNENGVSYMKVIAHIIECIEGDECSLTTIRKAIKSYN